MPLKEAWSGPKGPPALSTEPILLDCVCWDWRKKKRLPEREDTSYRWAGGKPFQLRNRHSRYSSLTCEQNQSEPQTGNKICTITVIHCCFDKRLSVSDPLVCQEASLQYWHEGYENAWRALRQFNSVCCNLRAFRLTKSITQGCGARASLPHNTHNIHCFCVPLLERLNTEFLISWWRSCMHGCALHGFSFSAACPNLNAGRTDCSVLYESRRKEETTLCLCLYQTLSQDPGKMGITFWFSIKLCPGAMFCLYKNLWLTEQSFGASAQILA